MASSHQSRHYTVDEVGSIMDAFDEHSDIGIEVRISFDYLMLKFFAGMADF